jgi:eukaryotic-like serine/threonine-protein kinase
LNVYEPTEAGSYPGGASPYGALDMAGNVWEWVNDYYQDNYYLNSPDRNPTGPATGRARVMRGGSCLIDSRCLRASNRSWLNPDNRLVLIGVRCVR